MKKILLNESEKKAIISEREQAIIKNFAKTFNTIKRVDENELKEERPISARYGEDPTPEQSAGIDKFVKDFLDKKDKEKKGEIKPNDTKISENDGEDYEAASRGVEYGINPYQDQPDMGLGELTQDREQGKMSYPPKTQENEWPKIGDIVKFKDNLADSYGNKYLVVSKGHGRHGHGELIAVSGDYGKYDDDISNTIYRVSDVFKTVAKTNQSWFLDELKHDIEYSDGNLSVQKIIDSALSGDI